MREKKHCEHCGASMMEHRHSLSVAMIEGLKRLADVGGAINIKFLGLTRNQWDNFQKLRYWGLVEKAYDWENKRMGGHWICTLKGRMFLENRIAVPTVVWTYRGEFIRAEELLAYCSSIDEGYRKREDYATESRARNPS